MQHADRRPAAHVAVLGVLARDVVATLRHPPDERRGREGDEQGQERRVHLRHGAEGAEVRGDGEQRGERHRPAPDRVDVVEVGALELDEGRADAQGLQHHEIRNERAHPGARDVGVDAEHRFERLEDPEQHQQQRDEHVEHQPGHSPGVVVRDPGEEVPPRERARVGIGDVDLDLRDDDEHGRHEDDEGGIVEHELVGLDVHVHRLHGLGEAALVAHHDIGEQAAGEDLESPEQDPAGAGAEEGGPPVPAVLPGAVRQEAQVVDLLADLGDEGEQHSRGGAEEKEVEAAAVRGAPREPGPLGEQRRLLGEHEPEGGDEEHRPHRQRPELQAVDQGDAEEGDGDDHQGAQHVPERDRQAEVELDRLSHDRGFQGEEDEREGGVDEGSDRRADVAEARPPREQVHVDVVAARVVGDGQAGGEDEHDGDDDRGKGVGEAGADGDRGADRLQREEGDAAERGAREQVGGPLAVGLRGVAQRVVLQRLVRDPGPVVASDPDHGAVSRLRLDIAIPMQDVSDASLRGRSGFRFLPGAGKCDSEVRGGTSAERRGGVSVVTRASERAPPAAGPAAAAHGA